MLNLDDNVKEKMKQVMSARYSPTTHALNLNAFYDSPGKDFTFKNFLVLCLRNGVER